MVQAYVIQSIVVTPVTFALALLFMWQLGLAAKSRRRKLARKHSSKKSRSTSKPLDPPESEKSTVSQSRISRQSSEPNYSGISTFQAVCSLLQPAHFTPASILANFRGNAYICGILGNLISTAFAIDSGRVHGIWTYPVTNTFGKLNTVICGFLVSSYVVAVITTSFAASSLRAVQPVLIFNSFFAALVLVSAAGLVSLAFVWTDRDTDYSYGPYLVALMIFELACVIGFDVAFFRFRKAVKQLRNALITRAISSMWRVFVLLHLFAFLGVPYQVLFLLNMEDRTKPHDADSYRLGDQYGLYFFTFILASALYVVWQRKSNVDRDIALSEISSVHADEEESLAATVSPSSSMRRLDPPSPQGHIPELAAFNDPTAAAAPGLV